MFLAVAVILGCMFVRQVPMAVDAEIAIKDREIKRIRLEMAKEVVRRIEESGREMVNKARREKK